MNMHAGNLQADPATVRDFLEIIHAQAARALNGADQPGLLQLVRIHPADGSTSVSRFAIGDVDGMVAAALGDAESGFNVYVEGRSVATGTKGRGRADDTRGVFALVVDANADKGTAGKVDVDASLTVETSPGNCHRWLFLDRALTPDQARPIGDAIRAATGADSDTGVITQPYRVAGTANLPDAKKAARGRVCTSTRILAQTGTLWTPEALLEAFPPKPRPNGAAGAGGASDASVEELLARCSAGLRKLITASPEPLEDRSAVAFGVICSLLKKGFPAEDIKHLIEAHPNGIGSRYAGSLKDLDADIRRAREKTEAGDEEKARAAEQNEEEPILDPWDEYVVPKFPFEVLPLSVQRFVAEQSQVIGCDPSALAMAVLANFAGSLDHRFRLKLMRHGKWWVSPRLWVLLTGDPSRKKTPIINAALAELEAHQNRTRANYEARMEDYETSMKSYDKKSGASEPDEPNKPPRYVVADTTVEKLAEILARSSRGVLVKRDELAGWLGSMEKYGGRGSSCADRAFWLQSFDGGPFTVDRIARGEISVQNLSTSLIGGIQPQKLSELRGLTVDGLLQRFLPVMIGPSVLPLDAPSSSADEEYRALTRRLIGAAHASLILADDALPVMEELRRHIHDLEQAAGGLAVGFQGFLGKLPGLAGSLAVILHLVPDPQEARLHPVSRKTAENVRRLVLDFILPHAFEFYRTAETVTDGDRIQRVASWIVTSGKTRVTARDVTHNVRDLRGASLKDVQLRMSPLVAGGWLTPESPGPDNRAWLVSSSVGQQFQERARQEEARKAAVARLMGSTRRGRE